MDFYNPDAILKLLRLNKVNHNLYNPGLLSKQGIAHFQEVFNQRGFKSYRIKKEFEERYISRAEQKKLSKS